MRRGAIALALAGGLLATSAAAQPADPDRLMADLTVLAADDMYGRGVATAGSRRAREHIVARFAAEGLVPAGADGWLQPFTARPTRTRAKPVPAVNVIGRLDGSEVNDRCLVLTAHYDHVGVRHGEIFNGADDNASGVAALIELARLFRAAPPRHCLLFVALDAEESGLLGAEAFVADPPVPVAAMAANINLDMVARGDDGVLWAVGTHQTPALRPLLESLATPAGVTLALGHDRPEDQGRDNWVELSDQAAFHAAGVPFLFFSVEDHADYHQPTDDAGRVDPAWYAGAVSLIHAVVRRLDSPAGEAALAR